MTDWENIETERDYLDSLTVKLFCFQSVNSYASLFYIAFLKSSTERGCANNDCMGELQLQLASIFITNLFLNLIELGLPLIRGKWKLRREEKNAEKFNKTLSKEEKEVLNDKYDTPLDDYMEIVIAYGYVVLFSVAFPFVPLLALFLAVLEVRVDAWKLCHLTRRPYPSPTSSIGVWLSILQTVAYVGAAINIGIVLFTANAFQIESTAHKWIFFLAVEHGIFVLKFVIADVIPDVPRKVKEGIVWSERVVNEKLYGKFADIDKERLFKQLMFRPAEREVRARDIVGVDSE
jgi:hypothetical protein